MEEKPPHPRASATAADGICRSGSGPRPIEIDGSYKEGGGQILRNAIAYAVLLQTPVTVTRVRANRPRGGGVKPQHLAGMKLAVDIGNSFRGGGKGELAGAEVGSETVSYIPFRIEGGGEKGGGATNTSFLADTGTAGSIALLLQAAYLPALSAASELPTCEREPPTAPPPLSIELRGGTNATGAPQVDYVTEVFAPFVRSYLRGACPGTTPPQPPPLDIRIVKRGYYPRGGGVVRVDVRPPPRPPSSGAAGRGVVLPPIRLTEPLPVTSLSIEAFHAGKCPAWVAENMASGAMKELRRAWREDARFRQRFPGGASGADSAAPPFSPVIDGAVVRINHETDCLGSGSGILIVARHGDIRDCDGNASLHPPLASSGLGDRRVPPRQTGCNAAIELVECISSGGCVDRWMQDQIVPFIALADGSQRSELLVGELTLHTQTAMVVAEKMTGCEFEVERIEDGGEVDGGRSPHYGENGRVLGKHVIRCRGIGFSYT